MTEFWLGQARKGFLVKIRINAMVFADSEEKARKAAMAMVERQLSYTGWIQDTFATREISTFVEEDGHDTFIDGVEELVIAPERAMIRNGVWARRETDDV